MGKAKRTLSVIMAALMLVFTVMTTVPASAAENTANKPVVTFVGIEHSPLVVGDKETFTITTSNADKVQYSITMKNDKTGAVEDLTNGYTAAVDGTTPYPVTPAKQFELGKYTLSITAKRVSDNVVSTVYNAAINCVTKDDANRVYANGAVDIAKTDYTLGDKITINGIKDLGGIPGPYKYRLHVYNATTGVWTNNVVPSYTEGKIEWTPSAPGTYVLDIHVNTEKSVTWPTYVKDSTNTKTTYEAWKLLTVTVTDTFKATSVKAMSATQVLVNFNKPVNEADAETTGRYHIGTATVNSAVMQDDTKSVLLTLAAPLSGTNLYVVDPVKLAADTTVTTPIYTFVETYSDTVAPTVTKVEYPVYNQAKVTFSEPMSALGNITATQNGATVSLPEVTGTTTFAAGKSAVYFDLSGLAADKPITVVMVGAKDQANNLINPNPTTMTFTMTKTDTTAPTVVEVKALSDTRVSVKFSEMLKENPSATVNGALHNMTWATDDNITYTATFDSLPGVAVFAVTKATDVSGNVNYDVTAYTKLLQLTQDTTAPVLASSGLKTFNNKQYLVLTFNEDVTVAGGSVTGTYVKDYVTKPMTAVTFTAGSNLLAYTKVNGADVDNSKAVMLDVTNFATANYTLTIPATFVKDLASTALGNAAFTVALTKGETIADSSAPYVGVDTSSPADGTLDKFVTIGANNEYFEVYFSEDMDPATALNVNNYKVGGACIFSNAILNGDAKTVRLTVTPGTIVYGGDYAVSVSGVKDAAGNVMTAFSKTFALKENVKPYIASAKLTANNKIAVTMSEDVTGIDANADFDVYVAGTKLTATTQYTVSYSSGVATITLTTGNEITDLTKTVQVKLVDTTVADTHSNLAVTGTLVTVTP